jgi:hypothetical protein
MYADLEARKPFPWGVWPQVALRRPTVAMACLVACGVVMGVAAADPIRTVPDAPPQAQPVVVPRATFTPSWDLDGVYLWLGPVGAASYVDAQWDSTFGGDATLVVVRERERLGLLGATVGASRWTARGGGRVWLDGLIGTRAIGRMVGASIGAILELSDFERPRIGGSIGVWAFAGVTPFARAGAVSDLGMFAELGLHIALPVMRR